MTWSLLSSVLSTSNRKTTLARPGFLRIFRFIWLMDKPLPALASFGLGPKAITAAECVRIISQAGTGWKFLEQSRIAAPQNNVINLQCGLEQLDDFAHMTAPFSFSQPLESCQPHIV